MLECSKYALVMPAKSALSFIISLQPKIQQTKMLVSCQRFGDLFFFWTGPTVFFISDKI